MDYFKPGLRELSRKLGRQRHRLRGWLARRDLAKAETDLGLLGWQQAEFDAETQAQVDRIAAYEKQQSQLTNRSADLGRELHGLRERRDAERKVFESRRRELETRRLAVLAAHPGIEKQLTELRKAEPRFARRMPELDRELREINKLCNELVPQASHTPAVRNELLHLRERSVAIPNEKSDLRNQHLRIVSQISGLESRLEKDRAEIDAIEAEIQELQALFDTADAHLSAEIKSRQRDKARLEKEINALEGAKVNPYQQIGRVLADHEIAPMNQPGALDKVKRLRARLLELDHLLALSFGASAHEDRQNVHLSWFLLGVIAVVALLIILATLPRA